MFCKYYGIDSQSLFGQSLEHTQQFESACGILVCQWNLGLSPKSWVKLLKCGLSISSMTSIIQSDFKLSLLNGMTIY
jgi:hypothetical protein